MVRFLKENKQSVKGAKHENRFLPRKPSCKWLHFVALINSYKMIPHMFFFYGVEGTFQTTPGLVSLPITGERNMKQKKDFSGAQIFSGEVASKILLFTVTYCNSKSCYSLLESIK